MKNFSDIKLNENIAKSLDELGFISPTPIQSKTIPLLLDTKQDLILIRSPDLNVLDYAIWAEVEKRLRKQERNMPAVVRESRSGALLPQ